MRTHQPETEAIMGWVKEQKFTASASLHGGALVANYPWDGSEDKRYPIYGGMQDWNYIHGSCFELTLEISDNKWPLANVLSILWEYNKKSMLNLVTGVHGRIISSKDGLPLPASVRIKGIDYTVYLPRSCNLEPGSIHLIVNANRIFSDYHRILAPGESYEVMASMPGFHPKNTHILVGDEATNLDFVLDPLEADTGIQATTTKAAFTCDNQEKLELVGYLKGIGMEMYILIFSIFLFLWLVLKRKPMFKYLKQRRLVAQRWPVF